MFKKIFETLVHGSVSNKSSEESLDEAASQHLDEFSRNNFSNQDSFPTTDNIEQQHSKEEHKKSINEASDIIIQDGFFYTASELLAELEVLLAAWKANASSDVLLKDVLHIIHVLKDDAKQADLVSLSGMAHNIEVYINESINENVLGDRAFFIGLERKILKIKDHLKSSSKREEYIESVAEENSVSASATKKAQLSSYPKYPEFEIFETRDELSDQSALSYEKRVILEQAKTDTRADARDEFLIIDDVGLDDKGMDKIHPSVRVLEEKANLTSEQLVDNLVSTPASSHQTIAAPIEKKKQQTIAVDSARKPPTQAASHSASLSMEVLHVRQSGINFAFPINNVLDVTNIQEKAELDGKILFEQQYYPYVLLGTLLADDLVASQTSVGTEHSILLLLEANGISFVVVVDEVVHAIKVELLEEQACNPDSLSLAYAKLDSDDKLTVLNPNKIASQAFSLAYQKYLIPQVCEPKQSPVSVEGNSKQAHAIKQVASKVDQFHTKPQSTHGVITFNTELPAHSPLDATRVTKQDMQIDNKEPTVASAMTVLMVQASADEQAAFIEFIQAQRLVGWACIKHDEPIQYLQQGGHADVMVLSSVGSQAVNLDLLTDIRSHTVYRRLPVVVVTQLDSDVYRQRAYLLGANYVLQRPYTSTQLKEVIDIVATGVTVVEDLY